MVWQILIWLDLIVMVFFIICFLSVVWSFFSMAPWVPSKKKDVKRIFQMIELKENQIFYDLGSGDGRTVLYAAKHFGVNAIGVELAFPLCLLSKFKASVLHLDKAKFKCGNLLYEDLSHADVVFIYLLPKAIEKKLKQKLEKELKKGAIVVSNSFKIQGRTPLSIDHPHKKLPIYLYQY